MENAPQNNLLAEDWLDEGHDLYEEIDIMLYLTPPDSLSDYEVDPMEELALMEAQLADHESTKGKPATYAEVEEQANSPEESISEEIVPSPMENESKPQSDEMLMVETAADEDAKSDDALRSMEESSNSSEMEKEEEDSEEGNECSEDKQADEDEDRDSAGKVPSVSSMELFDSDEEQGLGANSTIEQAVTLGLEQTVVLGLEGMSIGSSESEEISTTSSEVLASNDVEKNENESQEQASDATDDDEDTIEVLWAGMTPPWVEDPKANEADALLVHACHCDALRRCHDPDFGALCLNMRRFLRVSCWASHNLAWCKLRVARLIAHLLAYHSLHCQHAATCTVPLCRELRRT